MRNHYLLFILLICCGSCAKAQTITQFEVFAGRFDYLAIGNTLNTTENGQNTPCELLTESSATLSLEADQTVIAAYLYWAGSGTGDFEVLLNDAPITAERTFADAIDDDRPFFAGFTNISDMVLSTGSGVYTFGGLELDDILPNYCPTGTNFAGWSIIVVFEDMDLPLNQVNIFDGLESVSQFNTDLSITLTNLNVLDNQDARIGFLAWEGDANLAVNETLSINGNLLSNPPLNPVNNQFNGTNTFTNSDQLFNMDIDVYNIENNISIGDDMAIIELTSGQDFVMINTIITVLNSQLPDAVVALDTFQTTCNSRDINLDFTVVNQGTDILPAGTQVSFYGDGILTGSVLTPQVIPMSGSLELSTTLTIDTSIPDIFSLQAIVDDPAMVVESNEENNSSNTLTVNLNMLAIDTLENLVLCDDVSNDGVEVFNLEEQVLNALTGQTGISFEFYLSLADAMSQTNPIASPGSFENTTVLQTLYIRFFLDDDNSCFTIVPLEIVVSFQPIVPEIQPLQICDNSIDNDGMSSFNLNVQDISLLNNQIDVLLTYYETLEDAEIGINAISNTTSYSNTQNPQVIFVRLENEFNSNCYDVGFFDIEVLPIDEVVLFDRLLACNEGFEIGSFDLTTHPDLANIPFEMIIGYYSNLIDAENQTNAITDPSAFQNTSNPQTIYIRFEGDDVLDCFEIAQFMLEIENCPPFVPEGFSPNGDGINDSFEISGLKDVFVDYELLIYSRLGNLIYKGDNDIDFWDGMPNNGIGGTLAPTGVYYWVLQLNDSQIADNAGWVYLNR